MTLRTLLVLVATALVLGSLALAQGTRLRLPGDHTGYEPAQPVAFSHRLHAGELRIDCLYCHAGAEKSRHAGIPPTSTCMNCHRTVTAPWAQVRAETEDARAQGREPRAVVSPELKKVIDASAGEGIAWTQVHKLADFVTFDHRAHVNARVSCEACHGPVATMERVRQVESLSMGFCLDCHRGGAKAKAAGVSVKATTDCAACHN